MTEGFFWRRIVLFVLLFGLLAGEGCDKVQEVVQQSAAPEPSVPPEQAVLPAAAAPPAPIPVPPEPVPRTPEQILAEFQALKPYEITTQKLEEVTALASGLEQIMSLDVSQSQIGDDATPYFAKLSALESLNISSTRIGNAGAQSLSMIKNLRHLNIAGTSLDLSGFAAISQISTLEELTAGGLTAADNVFEHLVQMPNLRVLHLDGNKNMLGKPFTEAVRQNRFRDLRVLTVSSSEFGYYGLEAIGSLKELEELRAGSCNLADASVATIPGCVNLKILDLGGNRLSNNILPLIARLRKLESLSLAETNISDAGLVALKGMRNLIQLNLEGTACTIGGATTLKTKFLKNTGIQIAGQTL